MTMKHYFPKYCEKFRCIANLCPDSCCRDWDVVVDDTSFDFYNTVKGEFGDRLRSLMTIDEDGDRIFIRQGEKCPFCCAIFTSTSAKITFVTPVRNFRESLRTTPFFVNIRSRLHVPRRQGLCLNRILTQALQPIFRRTHRPITAQPR